MTSSSAFILKLESLKPGERSHLRRLVGQPPDRTLAGFDLFTGLWWPLRQKNASAPRREPSWLIAKLFGVFGSSIPHVRPEFENGPVLPAVLGACEPNDPPDYRSRNRFRTRFDTILCASLHNLESPLSWALDEIAARSKGASHGPEAYRGSTGRNCWMISPSGTGATSTAVIATSATSGPNSI